VAFVLAASYTAISVLAGGLIVTFPSMSQDMLFLPTISATRYAFQAICLLFFKNNDKTLTVFGFPVEDVLIAMELTSPPTVWQNVVALWGIFSCFIIGGFFCLKYLYKEKR